jgi:GntP family gluconate:H+ symporter
MAFVVAVALLIVLITRYALSPFVALLIASVALALGANLELNSAWDHFAAGVGGILGDTAMVIGLGAMIGMLLQRSGGAEALAQRLVALLGVNNLGWTMLIVGLLVGMGVWFTVGLVLLVPIVMTLARVAQVRLLVPAMALLAGLSAMHGLAPPHPGPLVAIDLLHANLGLTIAWSFLIAAISAAIAGPVFWYMFDTRITMPILDHTTDPTTRDLRPTGFLAPLVVIVLPIVLMVLGSVAKGLIDQESATLETWRSLLPSIAALGHPTMAMLIGLVTAYVFLGFRVGFSREALATMTQESLFPVANVLLVVAAGAGFSKILIASGVGDTLAQLTGQLPLPTLVLAWLIAAAFRVATGSATTAITAAGGIVSVMIADDGNINRELTVLAMGAGSLTLSHVNDGGFWFVKEFFGLTVQQTLRTWTVLETVLSLAALGVILILDGIV